MSLYQTGRLTATLTWISVGILVGLVIAGGSALWVYSLLPPHRPPRTEAALSEATSPAMPSSAEHTGHATAPDAALDPRPSTADDDILYWTCGMHPTVRSEEPGKCPICSMDLVPVRAGEQAGESGEDIRARLRLTDQARALAEIETVPVAFHHLEHEINTTGRLTVDERRLTHVHTRVGGWIDEVFVEFTGVEVEPGQPMVSIYSEELVTAQEEYLLALRTQRRLAPARYQTARDGADTLLEASRLRLLRWGITPEQIRRLDETGEVQDHMLLLYEPPPATPRGGIVLERMALEGMRVNRGDRLYTVADLSTLWMMADVYESEMPWIEVGLPVEITSQAFPGRVFQGEIAFINPTLDAASRTVRVRVDVDNPSLELRPEMWVDARIGVPLTHASAVIQRLREQVLTADTGGSPPIGPGTPIPGPPPPADAGILAIPDLAVLRTGQREIVYVEEEPGVYVRREVITGPAGEVEIDGERQRWVSVLAGLAAGERVVARGNFLLDSQTTLTGSAAAAYGSALETGGEAPMPPGHQH